jgi:hypothetical protein
LRHPAQHEGDADMKAMRTGPGEQFAIRLKAYFRIDEPSAASRTRAWMSSIDAAF